MLRCLRRTLIALAAVLVIGTAAVWTAPKWLPGVASLLITEDPLGPADLIVVLSGSVPDRPQYAAQLYHQGYAPRILCASSQIPDFLRVLDRPLMTQAELSAAVLRQEGVPEEALLVVNRTTSTFEELTLIRDTMREKGWRRVILVSSPTHMRRIRLTWRHLTRGRGPVAILRASPYSTFHRKRWWRYERDMILVQNEYAKILYYLLINFRGRALVDPH
jgi:uncharacterized SAM-binding protein YcdF (DUF218 family)